MDKKSILFIITKSVWGGASKYVYDLAVNLSRQGYSVAVAAGGKGELSRRITEANIPYYEIQGFQRKVNPFKEVLSSYHLFWILLKLRPDIVHVNSSKAGGIAGIVVRKYQMFAFKKIKLIFTAHGWAFNEDRPRWQIFLIKLSSKITCLLYDKIICVSDYDKKMAIENKIAKEKKLITIHNGIDTRNLSFLEKGQAQIRLINKRSNFLIGTIAEWTKNKGILYLLEAAKNIKDADFVLIGSGENPDKKIVERFIKENNLKNIHLHEFIPDAVSYLKAFDIFVLTSIKEGLPYTILEAMLSGIPVMSTNVGGIPEIINNNINGILIEPKNSQQLTEKIIYLKKNRRIVQNLVRKAQEKIIREFNLEQMIEKVKDIYA